MSKLKQDFRDYMSGSLSLESAVVAEPEVGIDSSTVLEIRQDRDEVEEELQILIEEESVTDLASVASTTQSIGGIVDAAVTVNSVDADVYVPVANVSLEAFSHILNVEIPRLEQRLDGHISLESIDSLRGWVSQASSSFKAALKSFFARIALWWRRLHATINTLRKRLTTIRSRAGSRKGTGGADLKLGKYAYTLVQGDAYAADPLAALKSEIELAQQLAGIVLAAQGTVEATLKTRLETLMATDRPASAIFDADLVKSEEAMAKALKSQPEFLLGNRSYVTNGKDDDYMLVEAVSVRPDAVQVAKNLPVLRSLSPEQCTAYLNAIDSMLDFTLGALRGIEKDSERTLAVVETAVDRVSSKYVQTTERSEYRVGDDGRAGMVVTGVERTNTMGRVMETEYEIVEVITGLSNTISHILGTALLSASAVLTLVEESIIQD